MKERYRFWLHNRYTVTLGSMALLAVLWNIYVAMNNDGIIQGRVVDSHHQPVPGATVVLSERTLLVTASRDKTETQSDGTFRFKGHNLYHMYLEAYKEGIGRMAPKEFRLYFRGQNLVLREPLTLSEPK